MSQFQENLWADGMRERQTVFYRTLTAETSGTTTSLQQLKKNKKTKTKTKTKKPQKTKPLFSN